MKCKGQNTRYRCEKLRKKNLTRVKTKYKYKFFDLLYMSDNARRTFPFISVGSVKSCSVVGIRHSKGHKGAGQVQVYRFGVNRVPPETS